MRALKALSVGMAGAALAIVLAACGGGSSSSSSTTTTVNPAQATALITTNWTTFFDGANSDTAAKAKLLQDSAALKAAVDAEATSPTAKAVSAKVKSVDILKGSSCTSTGLTSPCAKVTYDIVAGGNALLPNATGYAVRQGGKWLVSKSTFCTLMSLQGPKPQGC